MTTTVVILNNGHDKNIEIVRNDTMTKIYTISPGNFISITIWDGVELSITEKPIVGQPQNDNKKAITLEEFHD